MKELNQAFNEKISYSYLQGQSESPPFPGDLISHVLVLSRQLTSVRYVQVWNTSSHHLFLSSGILRHRHL